MRPRRRRSSEVQVRPVIRASELGSYAFCPLAWYLRREGWPPDPGTGGRLALGTRRHQAVGRRADYLRLARLAWRCLLLLSVVLAVPASLASLGVLP